MNFFKQWVPIFEWLPSYQKADLRGDAIAGITVAGTGNYQLDG